MSSTQKKGKVYITGATGFVGSHLAELLKSHGYQPSLLVRNRSRLPEELQEGYEIIDGSLNDSPEQLAKGLQASDYIYHIAGLINGITQQAFEKANVEGTRNLIEAAHLSGFQGKRFLLVSSLAAIGPSSGPDQPRSENDEPEPRTMYGASKLKGEKLAWELCERYQIPLTVVRPPAVYGPRDKGIFEFFKYMAKGIEVGFGKEKRHLDLIHGQDLVRGIMMAAESEKALGNAYFLTDEGKHELRALLATLREAMQPRSGMISKLIVPVWVVKMLARVNDLLQALTKKPFLPNTDKLGELLPLCWCCSGQKAREDFGFETEIPMLEGMRETSRWYENQGWLKVRR